AAVATPVRYHADSEHAWHGVYNRDRAGHRDLAASVGVALAQGRGGAGHCRGVWLTIEIRHQRLRRWGGVGAAGRLWGIAVTSASWGAVRDAEIGGGEGQRRGVLRRSRAVRISDG